MWRVERQLNDLGKMKRPAAQSHDRFVVMLFGANAPARHLPNRSQWMITANPCLRREIPEHVGRLLILSAHAHTPFTKRRGENTHERSFWLMIDCFSTASQEPKAQSLEPLLFQQPGNEASPQTAE
jgi:hypothetical protein